MSKLVDLTLLAGAALAPLLAYGQVEHGVAATALPRSGLPGPTVFVTQEVPNTLGQLRYTTWDETTQSWAQWNTGPSARGWHVDTAMPAVATHVRGVSAGSPEPLFDAYFSSLDRMARSLTLDATRQRFSPSQGSTGSSRPLAIRSGSSGDDFFPAAAKGWNRMQSISVMGTSQHTSPSGQTLFRVREYFNNGSNEETRDLTSASYPGAELIEFSSHAMATWEHAGSNEFSRTAVWREELHYLRAGNVVLCHTKGERFGVIDENGRYSSPDVILQLQAPGARIAGAPLLLTQSGFEPGAQNLFVVAEDPSGRRHLFERHNPTNDPADSNAWSEWRDHSFPAFPDLPEMPKVDDLSITAALVWRDSNDALRINMFGQRWGYLVEYWWNGGSWSWSNSRPLPPQLKGCRITSAAVAPREDPGKPRLAVFAVDQVGDAWEYAWSWQAGSWSWKKIQ